MKRPGAVAVLLACFLLVGGSGSAGLQVTATEYDAISELDEESEPEILGKGYSFSNGVMTLKGQIDFDEFYEFPDKEKVKEVVAVKGAVLPECCWNLFYAYTNCTKFDLSKADGSKVKNAEYMFKGCMQAKEIKLCKMSNLTDMTQMFYLCQQLETLDLSGLKTDHVTSMERTFCECKMLKNLDLSGFRTGNVTNMEAMFYNCQSLESLDISGFDTRKVTDMSAMFEICKKLESIDVSGFDTRNVTNMESMFFLCEGLKELDVSNFDTSNVTRMGAMFGSLQLETLDLHNFNTSKVTGMQCMFSGCRDLKYLDLSSFDMTNVTEDKLMFETLRLDTLILGENFKAINSDMTLYNCDYGWCREDSKGERISGDTSLAEFTNEGYTVYRRIKGVHGDLVIEGENYCGSTLKANLVCDFTHPVYQWARDGKKIQGATKNTYKLTQEDIGHMVGCEVTSSDVWLINNITNYNLKMIEKAKSPAAPTGLKGIAPSEKGKNDGKITGVKTTMEYATKSDFSDAKACTSTSITGLKAGTYYVRLKETEMTSAGETATVKVPQGVTPTPTPKPAKKVTEVYKDVKAGEWYVSAVQFVYDKGIMSGVDKKSFAPLNKLTRAQFVTTLYNLEGKPSAKYKKIFTDVVDGQWYSKPVMWAYAKGITSGISAKEFGVKTEITREQLATMLYNYATFKKYNLKYDKNVLAHFPDTGAISDWADIPMKWAVSKGVISGKTNSKGGVSLDPKGKATRAECAQMIKNLYDNVIKK